jgi:AcrR family transcriptional regulator
MIDGIQNGTDVAGRIERRVSMTRKRLLDAALVLFREKGVDATTIADITEQVDIGKGTFYRYFETKAAVVTAVAEEAVDHLVSRIAASERLGRGLPDVISDLLKVHIAFFREKPDEFGLLFRPRMLVRLRRDSPVTIEKPMSVYLEAVERQIAPHVPPPRDPMKVRRLAFALAGFVSGCFSLTALGMKPEAIEAGLEPLRRAFVDGASAFFEKR